MRSVYEKQSSSQNQRRPYHSEYISSIQALSRYFAKREIFGIIKNIRDRNQFSRLAQKLFPKHSVDLYDSYLKATAKPHVYLVLNLSQDINDLLKFRSEIFPEESYLPLNYGPIDFETDTTDFSQRTRF